MSLHIGAKKGEIAETVLLPGDPLRAKFIAENFLENCSQYTQLRNMFGYTGTYKGLPISVQGTGMGIPSTSIYTNELIREYGVKTMIRLGTCGSIRRDIKVSEVVMAMSASTDSSVNGLKFGGMDYAPIADFHLLKKAHETAETLDIAVKVGGILSTDTFYDDTPNRYKIWAEHGVLGVEMESSILYTLAAKSEVKALSILTVSDNLVTKDFLPPEEREKRIEEMTTIALETVKALEGN